MNSATNGRPPGHPGRTDRDDNKFDIIREATELLLDRAKEVARSIEERVWRAVGCAGPAAEDACPGTHRQEPRRPLHLLLVEDDPDELITLKELLHVWGHEVSCATGAVGAIAEVFHQRPDAIITDIGLPDVDGCALASELLCVAALSEGERPLLVAVSGLGDEAEDRCRAAGFDHFLRKPADAEELHGLLDAHRERRRAHSQAK